MKGEEVKEKVRKCGRRFNDIADDLGISPQALNKIFNSDDVRSSTIERIANVLRLPVTYFYEDGGYNVTASGNATVVNKGNVNNEERSVLVLADQLMTKDKQIDRLLGIIEKLSEDEK